jgi:hypothetical protein
MTLALDVSHVTMDTVVQAMVVVMAVLTLVITTWDTHRRDRQAANRSTYQRLELAAIDLFRFEAQETEVIRPLWQLGIPEPVEGTAEAIVFMNYVCQILNLFEMAMRFRRQKVIPSEVFASWVSWYFLVCGAPGFSAIWRNVRFDYTPDLRAILDQGVTLTQLENPDMARASFYRHVGELLDCPVILTWLTAEAGPFKRDPV